MRILIRHIIWKLRRFRISDLSFFRLFNFKDEYTTGRTLLMGWGAVASIANVFVTGTFQTAFLAENGIDIVRVGVITFIPYFAWILSVFAPKILQKFKKRRWLLLINHTFYYTCVVLGTTIMPRFVEDYTARTLWFGVFLLLANIPNALVGTGATAWHMQFIPQGEDRNIYYSFTSMVNNITGVLTAVVASLAADRLSQLPNYGTILMYLRIVSFLIFVIGGAVLFLVPKEFPYPISEKAYGIFDVLLKPIKAKKFMLTISIALLWNCICNFNASTWTYFILNTLEMPYIMTYVCSITITLCGFFMFPVWRKMVKKHSWYTTITWVVFLTGLMELFISFTTEHTMWIYMVVAIAQGFINIGAQLVFADVFYMNLPKVDTDLYSTFWSFSVNICVLLGQMIGTGILSLVEKPDGNPYIWMGLPFYGSQILTMVKFVMFTGMTFYIWKVCPFIKPEEKNIK